MVKHTDDSSDNDKEPKRMIDDNKVDEDSNKKLGIDRYKASSDESSYNSDDNDDDNDEKDDDNGDDDDFQALFHDEDASKEEIDDDESTGKQDNSFCIFWYYSYEGVDV